MFFAISFSFAQNLTATQKFPDSVTIGNSFIVTTIINGGPLIDFMEFSQPLPKGFTAKNIDSKGGDFEFTKSEVKIIWLTPPMQDTYTIKYLIQVPLNVSGKQTRSGKIIYITSNNERKVFVLQTKKIMLINPKNAINTFNMISSAKGPVRTSESDDFLGENGKPISDGFYVVIATFGKKENAERCRAANVIKGHMNTKIIQNQFTKVYNVFALKTNNKADADAESQKFKSECPDVWILKLQNLTNDSQMQSTALSAKSAETKASNAFIPKGGVVRTTKSEYFLDEYGKPVNNGFYIVIGTFGNKENAKRLRDVNIIKGHPNTLLIQNQVTKVYNIFVFKTNVKTEAEAESIKIKAEYPDAWTLKLE